MTSAFQLTIDGLTNSRNDAAGPTLIGALEADDPNVIDGVLSAIVTRRSKAAHFAVIEKWHELADDQREVVRSAGQGRICSGLRDGLMGEKQVFLNACEVIERFEEFDLVPTLVTIAEQPKNPRTPNSLQLISLLVERLNIKLHGPSDSEHRRDWSALRRTVLDSLERAVGRFRKHKRTELIESFVSLAGVHCETLQNILDAPHHPCFQTVVQTLTESESPGVVHLLFEAMKQPDAPLVIRNVVSHRTDPPFIAALCSFAATTQSPQVQKNLAKITRYEWLEPIKTLCDRFDDAQLAHLATLVRISGLKQALVLDVAEQLLTRGGSATRLEACELLAGHRGERPTNLVLSALEDDNPAVQASATRQLRERPVPDVMARLMKKVASPHPEVQEAARAALAEFTFESYLSQYDQMEDAMRRNKGALVCRVDPDVTPKLSAEMAGPTVKQRLRAIDMAESLGQTQKVADALVERLADEEHLVRAAAADALQFCTGNDVRNALLAALSDRSPAVQNSAKTSLEHLGIPITEVNG